MLNSNEDILLSCLAEECAEVQKEVSKILRFGFNGCNPFIENNETNIEKLILEIRDVLSIIELLQENNIIKNEDINNQELINKKKEKVLKYMEITKSLNKQF